MPIHIALQRGINVGGHNKIAMSDLRDLFDALGFSGARTVLQSGNVVFDSGRRKSGAALEKSLEAETAKRLGVSAEYIVRTDDEWRKIIARNPFSREAKEDPAHLLVVFLEDSPKAKAVAALRTDIPGREIIHADDRQLYVVYPDGVGRSKLTNALIERMLATRATARNWNTILKLADLIEE